MAAAFGLYRAKKGSLIQASLSGDSGTRTRGLLNAIQTRSQLRYTPIALLL